ncbi:MAG: hypothetical protein R2838_04265 [Caldilineaceae bacterium]
MAEKLLVNGFSCDGSGNWLLPDGSPWQLQCLSGTDSTHPSFRNCAAAVQAWKSWYRRQPLSSEASASLNATGDFDVSSDWPAYEPGAPVPDLYRTLNFTEYVKPAGDTTNGHPRWSSPEMDAVIATLRNTDPTDYQATVDAGIEGLKIAVTEMPGIPTFGYTGFITWDQTYWTNWPGIENAYSQPYTH